MCAVAFYFVHWLTDLAGAVPKPLEGSEKFVLKFPHPVLGSFIRSFGVINQLAHDSETKVFESYLVQTWQNELPTACGPVPSNPSTAIALMRLAIQGQTADKQVSIVDAFGKLPQEDQKVLGDEMRITGGIGQDYERSPKEEAGKELGPSILVYYSPAFIRYLVPDATWEALHLLAEVYRRARTLWPLQKLAPQDDDGEAASANSELAASHVIIRIDQMKDQTLADIQNVLANGETWVLRRRNELEGVVERLPLETLQEIVQKGEKAAVLKFWRQTDSPYPASDSSGGNGSEASFLSLQSGVTNLDSFNKMLASDSTMTSAAVKAKLNKIVARSSRKLVNRASSMHEGAMRSSSREGGTPPNADGQTPPKLGGPQRSQSMYQPGPVRMGNEPPEGVQAPEARSAEASPIGKRMAPAAAPP